MIKGFVMYTGRDKIPAQYQYIFKYDHITCNGKQPLYIRELEEVAFIIQKEQYGYIAMYVTPRHEPEWVDTSTIDYIYQVAPSSYVSDKSWPRIEERLTSIVQSAIKGRDSGNIASSNVRSTIQAFQFAKCLNHILITLEKQISSSVWFFVRSPNNQNLTIRFFNAFDLIVSIKSGRCEGINLNASVKDSKRFIEDLAIVDEYFHIYEIQYKAHHTARLRIYADFEIERTKEIISLIKQIPIFRRTIANALTKTEDAA